MHARAVQLGPKATALKQISRKKEEEQSGGRFATKCIRLGSSPSAVQRPHSRSIHSIQTSNQASSPELNQAIIVLHIVRKIGQPMAHDTAPPNAHTPVQRVLLLASTVLTGRLQKKHSTLAKETMRYGDGAKINPLTAGAGYLPLGTKRLC